MPLVNHFAAVVTFAPELPSRKRYDIVPVLPQHGETVKDVVATFEEKGHLGIVFEAADDSEAWILANTVLPHPSTVGTFTHRPNAELNARDGAYDFL